MSNVLSDDKRQQFLALGRLGWSLRRIEQATGVRRETAGGYLKAAGIYVRPRGGWGHRAAAKPANEVTTDSAPAKPANEATTDFGAPDLPAGPTPYSHRKQSVSNCEPYRAVIELGLNRGRNAMAICYIYLYLQHAGRIYLLFLFGKKEQANLSPAQVKALGNVIGKIKEEALDGLQVCWVRRIRAS